MAIKTRRTYAGAATSTTITAGINSSDTSITLAASTGWAAGPFYAVIDPGTSSEEKIYVGSRSGTSLTVTTRGVDGTTAKSHSAGAVIYPVAAAIDLDEANELASTYATRGAIVYQGASTFTQLSVGSNGQVLKSNGTDPTWGQVVEANIADSAVTSAKIADATIVDADISGSAAIALSKLATGALPTAITVASANLVDGTIVDADINASAAITLSKLGTGALPTSITVASANIVDGTIVAGDLATDAVTTAKIADGAVTTAKFASGILPVTTVTTTGSLPAGTDGQVAYVNDNSANEGLYTYNGTAWRKGPGWNAPWGIINLKQTTTSDNSITSTEEVQITSDSFTAVANRYYRITYSEPLPSAGSGYSMTMRIRLTGVSGTILYENGFLVAEAKNLSIVTTLTAGSTTIVGTLKTDTGNGTAARASTQPAQLIIEDIGPAGVPA